MSTTAPWGVGLSVPYRSVGVHPDPLPSSLVTVTSPPIMRAS